VLLALLALAVATDVRLSNEDFVDELNELSESDAPAVATATTVAPATAAPATAAPAAAAAATPGYSPAFCTAVIAMINSVRTNPGAFATKLENYTNPNSWSAHSSCNDGIEPKCLFTRSDNAMFLTHEGVKGIQAAINFLNDQQKKGGVPPVELEDGLCRAANALVVDQGTVGEVGHVGPRGSSILTRVAAQGSFKSHISEIVQYGSFLGDGTAETGPFDVVAQLIVCDGDSTRAHQGEVMSPMWKKAGADLGNHVMYLKMSCLLFTDDFTKA